MQGSRHKNEAELAEKNYSRKGLLTKLPGPVECWLVLTLIPYPAFHDVTENLARKRTILFEMDDEKVIVTWKK